MYSNQIEPSREERSSISSELVKCKSREAKCRISLLLNLHQKHLNFCIVRLTVYSAPCHQLVIKQKNQAMFMERDVTLRLLPLHFTTSDCYRDISSPHPHPRKYRCRAAGSGWQSEWRASLHQFHLSLSLFSMQCFPSFPLFLLLLIPSSPTNCCSISRNVP